MSLNAHSAYDAELASLLPEISAAPHLPGSADGPASTETMLSLTALLGAFTFGCDLGRNPKWQRRIWTTLALTGISIAAFGVAQKIGGNPVLSLVFDPERMDATNNFAMYRYRGNAGAYLNLIFPLVMTLTLVAFRRAGNHGQRAAWSAGLFLVVLGIQLNPSRASWLIAIVLGVIFAALAFASRRKRAVQSDAPPAARSITPWILLPALGFAALFGICTMGDWETGWQRAQILGVSPADRSPVEIYLEMLPKGGALGFGPGTFRTVFPSYQQTHDFGNRHVPQFWKDGYFIHAHEDYLETVVEWGWLGTALWAVLTLGGLLRALWKYFRPGSSRVPSWLYLGTALALGGVLAQALIDFPLQIASIQLYVLTLLALCWEDQPSHAAPQRKMTELPARF